MTDVMTGAPRTLAVFDFDDTLVQGDSFLPFLAALNGWPRVIGMMAKALVQYGVGRLQNKDDPQFADMRSFVKEQLIDHLLAGVAVSRLPDAIRTIRQARRWHEPMKQTLLDHHAEGHHIVIVSGALDLYLPDLIDDLPHDGLICTLITAQDGMVLTGMPNGNCVRKRKAELLADYIKLHGPFADSWGYGNYPHDVPMLELLEHRVIV